MVLKKTSNYSIKYRLIEAEVLVITLIKLLLNENAVNILDSEYKNAKQPCSALTWLNTKASKDNPGQCMITTGTLISI